ncbi:hypothetical protein Tco_0392592 [Tanacetum coccineum]
MPLHLCAPSVRDTLLLQLLPLRPIPKDPVPKLVGMLLGRSSIFCLPSWSFSSGHANNVAPYLSLCLSAERRSAAPLFLFALHLLPNGSTCRIPKLFPTASLSGSSHSYYGPFHCDSRNICLGFPCWVPPPAVLDVVVATDVQWLRFLEECLPMNPRLRPLCFLLVGETIGWNTAVACTMHDVLVS